MHQRLIAALLVAFACGAKGQAPPPQAAGYVYVWGDSFAPLSTCVTPTNDCNWYNPGLWYAGPAGVFTQIDSTAGGLHIEYDSTQPNSDSHLSSYDTATGTGRAYTYGYFEARMRWDTSQGTWPSFFTLAANARTLDQSGQTYPEIDAFEWQYNSPSAVQQSVHVWLDPTGTGGHFIASDAQLSASKGMDFSQFHTYGILWTPTAVDFYIDNVLQRTVNTTLYPYNTIYGGASPQPEFLNLSVGPGCGWTNNFTNPQITGCPTVQPTRTWAEVQWVHVFQPKSALHGTKKASSSF